MKRRAPRKYKPITRQALERMAIGYLQRFPASIKRFRTVMKRKIDRAHQRAPGDSSQYGLWQPVGHKQCSRPLYPKQDIGLQW